MAINKVIYHGDTLIDITDSTVTPETLSEGVIAYGANGERIVGTNAGGGAEVKLGELTITANGEYEASVYGATEAVTEVYNLTVPYAFELEGMGSFWKSNIPVLADFETFKSVTSLEVKDSSGVSQGAFAFNGLSWNGVPGVAHMGMTDEFLIAIIVEDPVQLEAMMGMQAGFERGIYICDPGVTAGGMEIVLISVASAPCDGYSKVNVDIPNGGLDWRKSASGVQYAIANGDVIVVANETIPDESFRNAGDMGQRLFIVSGVTSIGISAFRECSSLTSVEIPDSVTSIGASAFRDCSNLTSITIPSNITSIGFGAFQGCSSLTSIVIPNSVTSIGNATFWGCSSLASVVIGDSVTSIGASAFAECSSLTSVVIPDSITSIDYNTFGDCSGLTTITFDGTISQWNAITLDSTWNKNVPATHVTCSDGTVAL